MPRKAKTITYRGEALTITQWAKRLGCPRQTLERRIKAGWPTSSIVATPIGSYRKKKERAGGIDQLFENVP